MSVYKVLALMISFATLVIRIYEERKIQMRKQQAKTKPRNRKKKKKKESA